APGGFPDLERLARVAERGLFDFVLVGGGRGPEPVTVLDALAAVTAHIGLAATVDAAVADPFELVRRLATLDGLSAGRAGWHVGSGAAACVDTVREVWEADFTVPPSPQGQPVVIVAGDSEEEREFAAAHADVLLTRYGPVEAGRSVCADLRRRLARYGREPDAVRVLADVGGGFGGVAAELDAHVGQGAADGFLVRAGGLEEFVERVVPSLQERGAFRTEYQGATLRSHLGLGALVGKG
ncbi:hypothetical protein C3489_33650, partial [Streptomyces sp. Ru71]|uniref:LLM class flavin-dependent oxidoreductase n=1 Tax=Streptomyces sp. Ru71 TaxID=2080746 RepID=UPI000CDE4D13